MANLSLLEEQVLSLDFEQRALLADRLLASLGDDSTFSVVMTSELERLLDEGMAGISQAKSTAELRSAM